MVIKRRRRRVSRHPGRHGVAGIRAWVCRGRRVRVMIVMIMMNRSSSHPSPSHHDHWPGMHSEER
eukprot:3342017-Rhodomonas_salina.3